MPRQAQPKGELVGRVIREVLAYRGYASPDALAKKYLPDRPPLSGRSLRLVMDSQDPGLDPMKLMRIDGMLRLPLHTMEHVLALDADGVERLPWPDGDLSIRQSIVDAIREPAPAPRRRRANG